MVVILTSQKHVKEVSKHHIETNQTGHVANHLTGSYMSPANTGRSL